jgi:hypothetical protein
MPRMRFFRDLLGIVSRSFFGVVLGRRLALDNSYLKDLVSKVEDSKVDKHLDG